ncbi:MAG: hypothetical protein WB567_22525, partial [Terracidiphilus sp.]
ALKGGIFLMKMPLCSVLSVYSNSETAVVVSAQCSGVSSQWPVLPILVALGIRHRKACRGSRGTINANFEL